MRATVIAGKARMIRMLVIRADQVKMPIRIMLTPGARMFRMVTTKLNEPAIEATPRT